MSLVEELKRRQAGKSQEVFAAEIGITQSMLSRLYSGERTVGKAVARRIKRRFPDLTLELASSLLAGDEQDEIKRSA